MSRELCGAEKSIHTEVDVRIVEVARRLIPFARPQWKKYVGAGVLTILSASTDLAAPLVLLILIDKVIPSKDPVLLAKFGVGFIVLYFVRSVIDFIRGKLTVTFRENVVSKLQREMYEKIQRLPIPIFDETKTGYLASRVLADTTAMSTLVGETVILGLINLIIVAGTVSIVFLINWRLTLIAVSVAPIFAAGVYWSNKYIKEIAHKVQEEKSRVYGDIQESFAGIRLIRVFGLEKFRSHEVEKSINENRRLNVRLGVLTTLGVAIALMCTTFAGILILWYGSSEVMAGALTLGQLMAFSAYTVNIFGPIRNLIGMNLTVQTSMAAAERVFEMMDEDSIADRKKGWIDIRFRGRVDFRDVSFNYKPGVPVLQNINFGVEAGNMVALVGESGAGKTTLLSLLARLYDSYTGDILIDGVDIKQIKSESLLSQFGMVLQDSFLFSATVYENIRYGRLTATEDEIIKAAKAANAHQFIEKLSNGYQTEVGERGSNLSGGERQRIAIARAVLRNPRVLILDEATSSVDSKSENLIKEALSNLMRGRTTFVIAHRFSTVLSADKIVVLDKGRIVATGRHEELYNNSPVYRRLYDEQLSSFQDEKKPLSVPQGDGVPPRVTVREGSKGQRVVTVEM